MLKEGWLKNNGLCKFNLKVFQIKMFSFIVLFIPFHILREDYCYERYGFVFVEATDTLDAFSTLSEPLTDPHQNSASSLSPSGSLGENYFIV
jgi:hypothetical protein